MKYLNLWFFAAIITGLLAMVSCDDDSPSLKVDLSSTPMPEVNIKRYEQLMFSLPEDSILNELPKYKDEFPLFLGDLENALGLLQLKAFFADPYMQELNTLVQEKYPNANSIEEELSKAMQHYSYYYDSSLSFQYYSYISGLDIQYPIKAMGTNIVIGLDLYLGANNDVYSLSGFPQYKSKWLREEALVPDIMSELARGMMAEKDLSSQLLNQMLYEGKRLFFLQSMMPEISDTLLLHYTKKQMEWCYENEARLWSLMIENQFVFKNDVQIQKKFMDDGPFTSVFSTEAPSRLGHFLGWRIISKFMSRSDYQLSELMEEEKSQKILKESKYKPKR